MTPREQAAVESWRRRHESTPEIPAYFEGSPVHKGWRIYTDEEFLSSWMAAIVLTKSDTVLDIGCGYGEWIIPMSKYVKHVTGIDIHKNLILKVEEKLRERAIRNVYAHTCDGVSIPYADSSFTVVLSNGVFYHTPRCIVARYLPETWRVLKQGGLAFHHFLKDTAPGVPTEIGLDVDGKWEVGWSKEDLVVAAEKAGWENISVVDLGDSQLLTGVKK